MYSAIKQLVRRVMAGWGGWGLQWSRIAPFTLPPLQYPNITLIANCDLSNGHTDPAFQV